MIYLRQCKRRASMVRMKTISDQLRAAIDGCGLTRYRIAQLTGVPESTLSRFMAGQPMKSDRIDRIAPVIGVELVVRKRKGN